MPETKQERVSDDVIDILAAGKPCPRTHDQTIVVQNIARELRAFRLAQKTLQTMLGVDDE